MVSVPLPTRRPTTLGLVRGYSRDGVHVFRGIPYGRSTSGSRRFAPPTAAVPWSGTWSSLFYGPISPQWPSTSGIIGTGNDEDNFLLYRGSNACVQSEDCLRLNIWTPDTVGPHPVMVFLHGGGFVGGSGNDLLAYDGAFLARDENVVVVTLNHRLNAFGFLDLASLEIPGYENHVNVGLQDVVVALEWVQANIGGFGGDVDSVTLFGQSGGAMKVAALMAMPSAQELFHKAILQSGSMYDIATREESRDRTLAFIDQVGADPFRPESLAEIPLDRLVGVVRDMDALWAPTVDGHIITEPLLGDPSAPAEPMAAHIPIIVGSTQHEFVNAIDRVDGASMTEETMHAEARDAFGGRAAEVIAAFRRDHPDEGVFDLHATISAWWMRDLCLRQARAKVAQGGRAFNYVFAWNAPVLAGDLATYHGCDVAYAFSNALLCVNQTGGAEDSAVVGRAVAGAWAAFARTGSPNRNGLTVWPEWDAEREGTFVFDDPCRVVDHLDADALAITSGTPIPGFHGVG